jgi:hypothetical protein
VTEEFADLRGVERLFILGSWAARYAGDSGHEPRDVDVLVVGTADRGLAYDAGGTRGAPATSSRPGDDPDTRAVGTAGVGPFIREVQRRPLVEIDRDAEGR